MSIFAMARLVDRVKGLPDVVDASATVSIGAYGSVVLHLYAYAADRRRYGADWAFSREEEFRHKDDAGWFGFHTDRMIADLHRAMRPIRRPAGGGVGREAWGGMNDAQAWRKRLLELPGVIHAEVVSVSDPKPDLHLCVFLNVQLDSGQFWSADVAITKEDMLRNNEVGLFRLLTCRMEAAVESLKRAVQLPVKSTAEIVAALEERNRKLMAEIEEDAVKALAEYDRKIAAGEPNPAYLAPWVLMSSVDDPADWTEPDADAPLIVKGGE